MELIEAQQLLAQYGYTQITETRSEQYHEYLYSDGCVFVQLQEALRYSLEGRCNMIRISVNVTGTYRELDRFQQEHQLTGGFNPCPGQVELINWDIRMGLDPTRGIEALDRVLINVKAFDVRPGVVEVWSSCLGTLQTVSPV